MSLQNTTWTKIGEDLSSNYTSDVGCVSGDGNVIAICNHLTYNYAKIYKYNYTTSRYDKLGNDITISGYNYAFKYTPALNYDGTVFIGSSYAGNIGAAVFNWNSNSNNWVQKGTSIIISGSNYFYNCINNDGNIIGITTDNTNIIRTYQYNNLVWNLTGNITGIGTYLSCKFNSYGNILMTVSNTYNTNGGIVLYQYNNSSWTQMGSILIPGSKVIYGDDKFNLSDDGYSFVSTSDSIPMNTYKGVWSGTTWNITNLNSSSIANYPESGYGNFSIVGVNKSLNSILLASTKTVSGNTFTAFTTFYYDGSSWSKYGPSTASVAIKSNSTVFMYSLRNSFNNNKIILGEIVSNQFKYYNYILSSSLTTNIVVSPIINTFYGNAIFNIGATTNNTETPIVYTSGNTFIATVNSFGNVTVGNVGSTTISMVQANTANYIGTTANTTVNVSKAITNITANATFNVAYKSASFNLNANTNNTETPIVYTTGNTFIATVDQSGNVIIGNVGNVTISMTQANTTNYLGITANTTVNVARIQPTITVVSSRIQSIGDPSFNLGATTTNTDTSVIQYTSTNPNVANVVSGIVTIGNTGITTITSSQPQTANYLAVSANTVINVKVGYLPRYVFDNRLIPASITEWWSELSTYNATTGAYTGSQSTTYNTSLSASGEWLQVKINSAIVAKYYQLSWVIDSSTNNYTIPKSWILLGSTDTTSWSLIDSFNYQLNTAPTNTSAKPVLIKLRNIYTNNLNVQWYRLIVTSIFPGGSLSYTRISEMDFFAENTNTLNINRRIKPIVTRTHVLHPITIIPFSTKMGDQTVYMLTDLCCNLIENNTINNGYNNTNIIKGADKNPITSTCFDGQNLMTTPMTGNICYINNDGMNTNMNFDISLNGSLFQKNITGNIYASCFNGQRIIMGGTGTNVITYISPLQNSPDASFKPALNANNLMTSVYGLASNSGYGHVYIPNRIYLNPGDRVSVVAPKSYNEHLSDTNTISMNLNNATITKNI